MPKPASKPKPPIATKGSKSAATRRVPAKAKPAKGGAAKGGRGQAVPAGGRKPATAGKPKPAVKAAARAAVKSPSPATRATAKVPPRTAAAKTAASKPVPKRPPPGEQPPPPPRVAAKAVADRPRPTPAAPAAAPAVTPSPVRPKRNGSGLSARDTQRLADLLLAKRREIVGDMHSMEGEALRSGTSGLSNLPVHLADMGTDNYEQEFTLGLVERDRTLLREINHALAKIPAGTFGICEGTGEPIGKARLEFQPWARFSIEHARQRERNGRGVRVVF